VSGGTPRRRFVEYRARLDTRLTREQRPPTSREYARLLELRDTWDREYQEALSAPVTPGLVNAPARPPDRAGLEVEYAPAEPVTLSTPTRERRGPKELGIPERELWWIIDRWLENSHAHSRKWLAGETDRRDGLDYVPRTRLSPLIDWCEDHEEAARRAARLRVIPAEFRAGKLGPIPPQG
jgi:hypothetical protein